MRPLPLVIGLFLVVAGAIPIVGGEVTATWWWMVAAAAALAGVLGLVSVFRADDNVEV